MTQAPPWREIAAASAAVSDQKLLDILALIDRLPEGERPHDLLEVLRPRLVRLKPPRHLTLQRVAFLPVEDLFDPPDVYRRKVGRLSRAAIRLCWRVINDNGDQALLARAAADLKLMDDPVPEDLLALADPVWRSISTTLRTALERGARDHKLGVSLFGRDDDVWRQIGDIADIMEIGFEIESAKLDLPAKPVASISTGQAELLASSINRLAAHSLHRAKCFILVIAARMVRPGELLEVLAQVKLPHALAERESMVRDVEGAMVTNLVRSAQVLREAPTGHLDPVTATETARQLVEGFVSLRQTLSSLSDAATIAKVQAARREIASYIMDNVIERADTALSGLMTPQGTGPGGPASTETRQALSAVVTGLLSDEQQEAAETFALSLRHCAGMAETVGIQREVGAKLKQITHDLERRALAPSPDLDESEKRLYSMLRLIETIDGPDAAERLLLLGLERLEARQR